VTAAADAFYGTISHCSFFVHIRKYEIRVRISSWLPGSVYSSFTLYDEENMDRCNDLY